VPRPAQIALYVLAIVVVVVGVDVLFLRDHVWARLVTNVAIVLVLALVGSRVFRHPSR